MGMAIFRGRPELALVMLCIIALGITGIFLYERHGRLKFEAEITDIASQEWISVQTMDKTISFSQEKMNLLRKGLEESSPYSLQHERDIANGTLLIQTPNGTRNLPYAVFQSHPNDLMISQGYNTYRKIHGLALLIMDNR